MWKIFTASFCCTLLTNGLSAASCKNVYEMTPDANTCCAHAVALWHQASCILYNVASACVWCCLTFTVFSKKVSKNVLYVEPCLSNAIVAGLFNYRRIMRTISFDKAPVDIKTGICTAVKPDFYFRFRPSLSTMSPLHNFTLYGIFLPIYQTMWGLESWKLPKWE